MDDENRSGARGRRSEDLWLRWDKRVRDSVIFFVGIGGVVNELFIVMNPRPAALLFLGSLIGVPFVLSADENKRERPNKEDRETDAQ